MSVCLPRAGKRLRLALAQLPDRWDMLYLGYNRYFNPARDCQGAAAAGALAGGRAAGARGNHLGGNSLGLNSLDGNNLGGNRSDGAAEWGRGGGECSGS